MDRKPVPETNRLDPRALPRFFVTPDVLHSEVLPDAVAHQVHHVLRLHRDDAICLLDGTGIAWIAQLTEKGRFRIVGRQPVPTEPPLQVTLLQALIRTEKLETAIRLCVQAGAAALWIAPSQRSIVRLDTHKHATRQERWQKVAIEEAELAYRARVPQVRLFAHWHEAFAALPRPVLVLDEWEQTRSLPALLSEWADSATPMPHSLSLVVGPEGGFAPEERTQMAQEPSVYSVSLGPRCLRTESAGFYALAQLWACVSA